jgi:hypothetical protein
LFELHTSNAADYLNAHGITVDAPRITELGGGVSNTVLLVEAGSQRLVVKQALGKLRVQADWFSDRGRASRE